MHKEALRKEMWILDRKKELPDIAGKTVISPLHYGETIEIMLIRGIEGEAFINGKKFVLEHSNVFFIPPRHLHTAFYRKGGLGTQDIVCSFHINLDALAPFIDIKNVLLSDNRSLFSFPSRFYNFERVWELIQGILDEHRLFCSRLADFLQLMEMFSKHSGHDTENDGYNLSAIRIVDWIEERYAEKISVQDAADYFGFSKYYFCKWFKQNTGVTFMQFLNSVRINHACTALANGFSIEETAERCGYSDTSYFIKVFKRFRGVTPKAHIRGIRVT